MNILSSNSSDLRLRFPEDRYSIYEIPYIILEASTGRIHVLRKDECKNMAAPLHAQLKKAIVVTKRFNWSIKNDLIRKSQWYSPVTYKWETNPDLYSQNLIKELLVYIIDDGDEAYVDEEIRKGLSQHFVEGFLHYFFSREHFDTMTEKEEDELRRHIHKFYSYWRKANSKRQEDQQRVAGENPPVCPSIILEVGLADRFNWTLEYIRNLSEKDVRSIQILQSQKEIADYEGSDRAKHFGDPRKKGSTLTRNLSLKEAMNMLLEDEAEKKTKAETLAKRKEERKNKPLNAAQLRAKALRDSQQQNYKIKKQ